MSSSSAEAAAKNLVLTMLRGKDSFPEQWNFTDDDGNEYRVIVTHPGQKRTLTEKQAIALAPGGQVCPRCSGSGVI